MGRPPKKVTLDESLNVADVSERELRRLISRWWDDLPAELRAQLTRPANRLLRMLLRAGWRK